MNKTIKWIIGIVVIALVIWGLASWSGPSAPADISGEPIKIGVITALTGDGAALGEFIKNVTDLAVGKINSDGGISGRTIELIYEDDMCSGRGGANAIQKLVSADNVKLVIGSSCSSGVLSAIPIADQNKAFVFSGTATSPDLTGQSQFFARTIPSDSGQGKVLAEAAIERGWENIAALQESSDYALGVQLAFEENYKTDSRVVSKEEYPGTTTDFRSVLAKLRALNPDALFINPQTPGTAERIFSQLSGIGWQVPLMVNDLVTGNAELVGAHSTLLEGTLAVEQGAGDSPEVKQFEADYVDAYGKEMIYRSYSQAQYDLVYILAEGIDRFGEDAEAIAEWVRTLKDWPGIAGPVTIGLDGDRVGGHTLKIIRNGVAEPYTAE
jgi:branched-chain amino acid transport system substrate-binding protein